MFTFAGTRYVVGAGGSQGSNTEWIVFDLKEKRSTAFPLSLPESLGNSVAVWGSVTRDDQGRFYVAGRIRMRTPDDVWRTHQPLLLQVSVEKKVAP